MSTDISIFLPSSIWTDLAGAGARPLDAQAAAGLLARLYTALAHDARTSHVDVPIVDAARLAAGLGCDPADWTTSIDHLCRAGLARRVPDGIALIRYVEHGHALTADLEKGRAAKRDRQARWRKRAKKGEVGTPGTTTKASKRSKSTSSSSSALARTASPADLESYDLCKALQEALADRTGQEVVATGDYLRTDAARRQARRLIDHAQEAKIDLTTYVAACGTTAELPRHKTKILDPEWVTNWSSMHAQATASTAAAQGVVDEVKGLLKRIESGDASPADASPAAVVWRWANQIWKRWKVLPPEWEKFKTGGGFARDSQAWLTQTFIRDGAFDAASAWEFVEWRVRNFWTKAVAGSDRLKASPDHYVQVGRGAELPQMTWSHLTNFDYLTVWRRERESIAAEREKEAQANQKAAAKAKAKAAEKALTEAAFRAAGDRCSARFTPPASTTVDWPAYWTAAMYEARRFTVSSEQAEDMLNQYLDDIAAGSWPAPDGIVPPASDSEPDSLFLLGLKSGEPTFTDWRLQRLRAA